MHSAQAPIAPTVLSVVGARPQFVKAAMLSRALAVAGVPEILVHTGQHYDANLSAVFFDELKMLAPKYNLEIGSGSHAKQTAMILERLDEILEKETPAAVIVYGDTNSTLAAAVAASKRAIPVIHVEAGMRSHDRYQPEEINRVVTDHLSEVLLCVMPSAVENLAREGIELGVTHIGDVMYDALIAMRSGRDSTATLAQYGVTHNSYILATVHRPESTDNPAALRAIVNALCQQTERVLFPMHPRTRAALTNAGMLVLLESQPHITVLEPLPYTAMMDLVANARVVFTESGGLQKEAYFLGIPCVNPRDRTEWHELVETGWQTLASYDEAQIMQLLKTAKPSPLLVQGFGDGNAATQAAHVIRDFLQSRVR